MKIIGVNDLFHFVNLSRSPGINERDTRRQTSDGLSEREREEREEERRRERSACFFRVDKRCHWIRERERVMLIQSWSICVSTSKAEKMHCCWLLLLLVLVKMSLGKTSIRTALTVEVKENEVVGSEVVDLNVIDAKKKMKINLLEVNGYEMKYFQLKSDEKKIFTRQVINREEFLDRRYCLNRLYCLIELHLLINDGEEYWIIPIHLIE